MAKKDKPNLGKSDFLGDIDKFMKSPTGSTIYEKELMLYRTQVMEPVISAYSWGSVFDNVKKIADERDVTRRANLKKLISAMPEIDESLLYSGIEDIATDIMKSGNMEYREIAEKLAGMHPNHKDYEGLAKKLKQIEKNTLQLKEDNQKLLNIRNSISGREIEDWSKNMDDQDVAMYTDIMKGESKNFKNINGKLYWINPEKPKDPVKVGGYTKLDIKSKVSQILSAATPIDTKNLRKHYNNDGSERYPGKDADPKARQQFLLDNGYDISYISSKTGKKVEGQDAVDGDMREGGSSDKAEKKYLADREEAFEDAEKTYLLTDPFASDDEITQQTHPGNYVEISTISADGPIKVSKQAFKSVLAFAEQMTKNGEKMEWSDDPNSLFRTRLDYLISEYIDGLDENAIKSLIFDSRQSLKQTGFVNEASIDSFISTFVEGLSPGRELTPWEMDSAINKMKKMSLIETSNMIIGEDENGNPIRETKTLKKAFQDFFTEEYAKVAHNHGRPTQTTTATTTGTGATPTMVNPWDPTGGDALVSMQNPITGKTFKRKPSEILNLAIAFQNMAVDDEIPIQWFGKGKFKIKKEKAQKKGKLKEGYTLYYRNPAEGKTYNLPNGVTINHDSRYKAGIWMHRKHDKDHTDINRVDLNTLLFDILRMPYISLGSTTAADPTETEGGGSLDNL